MAEPDTEPQGAAERQQAAVRMWIGRARAGAALFGFALATFFAYRAGLGLADAMLRGLVAALVFSAVGWWCGLLVMRALLRTVAARRVQEEQDAVRTAHERALAQTAATEAPAPSPEPVEPA